MTAKTFEEWIGEQPVSLQKNLTERDEAMKRDAFEAGMRASRAALLADRPDVAKVLSRLRDVDAPICDSGADALESLAAQLSECQRALHAIVCDYVPTSDVATFDPWLREIIQPIIDKECAAMVKP